MWSPLFLPLIVVQLASNAPSPSSSPAEEAAERLVAKIPERALSLAFVLEQSMAHSDSFASLRAKAPLEAMVPLQASQFLVPQFHLKALQFDNHQEPSAPLMPQRTESSGLESRLQWTAPTGTTLMTSFNVDKNKQSFPTTTSSFYQSSVSLSFQQDLLKDFGGFSLRRGLTSASHLARALRHGLTAEAEAWYLQMARLYYQAWLLQRRAEFSRGFLERRQQLLRVIRARARRGVSPPSEVYQTESAVLAAEIESHKAEALLQDAWRALVMTLKLPEILTSYPADRIPFKITTLSAQAMKSCETMSQNPWASLNSKVKAAAATAEAARDKEASLRHLLWPALTLSGQWSPLNNDAKAKSALADTFQARRSLWAVSAQLSLPLGPAAEKASWIQASVDLSQALAQVSSLQAQTQISGTSLCYERQRLIDDENRLVLIHQKQAERERLEIKRFELGSTSVLSVVQAGDDYSSADMALHAHLVSLHLTDLELRLIEGALTPFLSKALFGDEAS